MCVRCVESGTGTGVGGEVSVDEKTVGPAKAARGHRVAVVATKAVRGGPSPAGAESTGTEQDSVQL